MVTGQANGLTARDFAIATVIVGAPSLPNTGIGTNWIIGILTGLLIIILIGLVSVLRKRIM